MLKIEYVKTADLIPYANNPRKNDAAVDKVVESIREFGFKNPIIVDGNNEIIAGHTRLKAAEKLGMEEVPTIKAEDLTPEQVRAFRIADNKTHEFAGWDMDLLREELDGVNLFTGFDEDELREILDNVKFSEVEEDDFDPTPPEEPKSKLGDIYQLGRHRLMCGDSTDKATVEKLMNGVKADMVFTDPPYGIDYSGRGENTSNKILNDNIDPTEFYNIGNDIEERYIWGRVENYIHLHEKPRDIIIWKKNNFGMGRGYRGQYECCFYYGAFNGSDSDVWEIAKDTKYLHPTQKPVQLCARAIKNSNPKTVVDYFGGSGSTLIACEQLNRTCYMMELDPGYCDVIINRWEQYTGQKAVRLNG